MPRPAAQSESCRRCHGRNAPEAGVATKGVSRSAPSSAIALSWGRTPKTPGFALPNAAENTLSICPSKRHTAITVTKFEEFRLRKGQQLLQLHTSENPLKRYMASQIGRLVT